MSFLTQNQLHNLGFKLVDNSVLILAVVLSYFVLT